MEFRENDSSEANYIEAKQAEKIYPTLGQSWGLFGILIGTMLITGLVAAFITDVFKRAKFANELTNSLSDYLSLVAYVLSFALTFILVRYYVKGCYIRTVSISTRSAPAWIFLLLVLATPAMSVLVESIVVLIPMPESLEAMFKNMVKPTFASFLTAVVAAPVLEEIFCRGIILEGLLRNGYRSRDAVLWSAFIFAVMHMNPWQGVAAMTIGCFAGWIYVKTRSLWPCIFIHFLNNCLAFIGLIITRDGSDDEISDLTGEAYPFVLAVSALVFAACIYVFRTKFAAGEERAN
ncbi:MAG: CPBP family intramembrane metalloprotease [Prevotellaceae bacterium]|jgi:membrane protease YdiL (CAAX protease family)|nr:CPBP family intramembrane metalloprotease [Prevotellaceae bacterium]